MRPLGLRTVLVTLVVAALLPASAVVLVSAWIERREALESERADLNAVARLAAATEEKFVEGVRRMLVSVAVTESVRELELPRCTAFLDRLRQQSGDYTMVTMLDTLGNSTCHDPQAIPRINAADRSYFKRAAESLQFSGGDYVVGRQTGRAIVGFGMPVLGNGGELRGVAVAAVDLRQLNAQLRGLRLSSNLLVQLADSNGTVLASNQSLITAVGTPLAPSTLLDALKARRSGPIDTEAPDGSRWLHVLLPIEPQGQGGMFIAVSTREDAALAPSVRRLRHELLALALAGLGGVLLAWWLSRHLVQRPVTELLGRMRGLGHGGLGPAADAPPRPSPTAEFVALDAALAQLAERLHARKQERDALLGSTQAQAAQLWKVQRLARIAPWEISLPDGRMASSPMLEEILGSRLPERVGDRLAMVHPADIPALKKCLIEAMAGVGMLDVEFRVLQPGGTDAVVHALGELERGADHSPRRLVGALQDVSERRRAELALREHQARQAAAVAAARLGTYDEDLQTGRVVWLGHHEEMWGYAPGEFDGTLEKFTRRVHPDDLDGMNQEVKSSIGRGLPFRCEYRVVWPDGSVHWVVDSGSVVCDDAGKPLRQVGVVMDITTQKLAQLRIAEMSRRISGILESTSDGFVAIDRGWRVTQVNRHGASLLGHAADEVIGRTLVELFGEAGRGSDFEQACLRAMRGGGEQHLEACYLPWGRWFENHVYPTDEGLSIFFRDISERKRAEADIRDLVARLQALREMDRALLQLNSIEEVVLLGLARLRSLLGCTRTAYMRFGAGGETLRVLWTDGDGDPVFPPAVDLPVPDIGPRLKHLVDHDNLLHVPDLTAMQPLSPALQRMADHGVRALLALPLRVEGVLVGVTTMWAQQAGFFTDERIEIAEGIVDRLNIAVGQVTLRERVDRHAAELEQRVADRTAEVVAANKELEAFSYSVSHDLRAPLQSVGGFSQALLTRHAGQFDDKARHYLERINAGAAQMEALISDLLSLAQVSHAPLEVGRLDLAGLGREVLARLQERDPERKVDIELPARLPVWGDRPLLQVLLDNLLGNAWKFTSHTEHARIELGVERGEAGEEVFFVADNGVGFDMRYAERLFTAFRRLHSSQEFPGTGIGLATVQRIALRHGGRVWATSTPGVATVLRFTLPAPAQVPAAAEEARPQLKAARHFT